MKYEKRAACTFILSLTLLLCLTPTFSSSTGFSKEVMPVVNVTNLIKQYVLVCGHEWICDPSYFGFLPTDTTQMVRARKCPYCSCDYQCVIFGTCCPDVNFMVPAPKCKNTVLQDTSNLSSKTKASMIDTCGISADDGIKNKCVKNYTINEMFENPPVTSTIYAHTFSNKYCAECNNVTDYELWNLNIDCNLFADFNFLSSYSEIMDLAKQKSCLIEYAISRDTYKPCDPSNKISPFLISACNTTGHWVNYNQDIALACENSNYNVKYRHYKNIFCKMCNPIPQTSLNDIISKCNVTGAWDKYDKSLEAACFHQEYTSATFPFKNVYCHLCNKNNSGSGHFVDATVRFNIQKLSDHIHYKISLRNYNTDFYRKLLNEQNSSDFINTKGKEILPRVNINNMTNVLLKDYSTDGVYRYCDKNLTSLVFVRSECSCKPQCFFEKGGTCCVETALEFPVSCYSDLFLSGDNRQTYGSYQNFNYAMVDGCYNVETDNSIRRRCENPSNTDIFSMIPVLDKVTNVIYRNYDCFVCNQPGFSVGDPLHYLNSLSFSSWDIDIYCHIDLNVDFHLLLGDLLKLAMHHGCIIKVKPTNRRKFSVLRSRIHCEIKKSLYTIEKCNVTGHWYDYDPDLQEACENSGSFLQVYGRGYKNVFCFLCNPLPHPGDVIPETCNVTDITINGEAMLEACETFPFIQHKLPFKNVFCEHCQLNRPILSPFIFDPVHMLRPSAEAGLGMVDFQPNLRSLFGPWNRPKTMNSKTLTISVINTSNAEIFDTLTMTHRYVTCFPGKRLIKSSCIPLLTTTNNLRYLFAIALDGEVGSNIVLWDLLTYFKNLLTENLLVDFESFYIVSDVPCHVYNIDSNGTSTNLLLHTTFKVLSFVDRLDLEERLLNMSTMNYTFNGYTLTASIDQRAFLVPSMIHQINYDKNCFVSSLENLRFISETNYRPTVVSSLMLCRQIELDVEEFDVDDTRFELTVKDSKTVLGFGEFFITKTGAARVCVEDFVRIRSQYSNGPQVHALGSNEENEALQVTTLVCTVLSLTCLLLTFVTYVLFKSLRSVPGINNMCLVFSMFFAIGLFQFGYQQTKSKIGCKIIGISSHFFWLSTFGCMSVCSFHMYSVFTNLSHTSGSSRKTIVHYILYAYGIPTLIICVNIAIIASTSNGKSIGYGEGACFLSNRISFYLTFLSPVVIVCFTNIFFFVKTTVHIKSKPNIASNRENRNDFVIYVKLFSITGITWLLLILDTLFPLSAFSFIVTILNACQGIFIFVSFVCNKRVMSLYKNTGKGRENSMTSNATKSTTGSSRSTMTNSSVL